MAKAKTVVQRRQDRKAIELRKKSQTLALDDAPDDVDLQDESGEENPSIGKKDYYPDTYIESPGPTSFDELDQIEAMQSRADEIQETAWDARTLVRNILNHPEMTPKDMATAIQGVGSDFGDRVSMILDGKDPDGDDDVKEKDIDILQIESILSKDKRDGYDFIQAFMDKAKLTASSRKKLSPDQFALPDKKKYPIHDKAHVRNALARAAQEMKAGGTSGEDAKQALPAIHAAAKKFGIGSVSKKERGGIIVEKDSSGAWRWVGWPSNNFIDSDGDIFAEVAHKEYIRFLDTNPEMAPAFMTWHTPGTSREYLPDYWSYENGFLVMSGKLEEKEAKSLLQAAAIEDQGMSHGVLVFERDQKDRRVVTKYRMYEVSDLPLERASNPFTTIATLSKEAEMSLNKQEYLALIVGEEKAKKFVDLTAATQKSLQQQGVESKEKKTDEHTVEVGSKGIDEEALNTFLSEMLEKQNDALEKVSILELVVKEQATTISELTKSSDEKLADKIEPPSARVWMLKQKQAEQAEKNKVPPADGLAGMKPELGDNWLSEATGTAPLESIPA